MHFSGLLSEVRVVCIFLLTKGLNICEEHKLNQLLILFFSKQAASMTVTYYAFKCHDLYTWKGITRVIGLQDKMSLFCPLQDNKDYREKKVKPKETSARPPEEVA